MSIFSKFFGNEEKPQPEAQNTKVQTNTAFHSLPPCSSEQELIERYGAIALEKQDNLGEVIGDNNWNADIPKGVISFGDNLEFPIQILGTFSHSSQTWLWAWANTQSGLPPKLIEQALALKEYGEKNNIDLLTVSQFEADNNDLHLIGAVASGMFDASAYYIADYGQGAMVVTIKSDLVDKQKQEISHLRIPTIFSQLITQHEVNHHNAFRCYLLAKGYTLDEQGSSKITGTKDGLTISAGFDELGRLVKIEA
ncbi:hypothetical protein D0T84_15750 [Dysgonomonas sp. 521]|uniref:DUF6882 domain-containing protein n=1 Tax=Dysgonomonas sp. 521 TaxID=2302932 RepID=UPI0013D3A3FB|nr:DUF6882 domain-containing protein [Dysgonomonas sp. 521]NDV96357.1 hypothetical protein [Dysgonomonas sp. 521]